MPISILAGGLFVLAVVSGMLGLGVAFAAVPFLGLFLPDLVHQVQPLWCSTGSRRCSRRSALPAACHVLLKQAIALAVITTMTAPIGAYLAQDIPQQYIWYVYFAAVLFLAYRLLRPGEAQGREAEQTTRGNLKAALILAVPISILSGLLGVGPGFLLRQL
jgi:uncharacterized membrane protein YfcA